MRKKRRRPSPARRPNATQGKARHGQRLARAGHERIKARHWPRRQCSGAQLGAQPMRYQRLPLAVIQSTHPTLASGLLEAQQPPLLFLRFWLFGIYVNCFESALSTGAIESGSSS